MSNTSLGYDSTGYNVPNLPRAALGLCPCTDYCRKKGKTGEMLHQAFPPHGQDNSVHEQDGTNLHAGGHTPKFKAVSFLLLVGYGMYFKLKVVE